MQTIHIWAGQRGTMCSLQHIAEKDGFVWLSKMGTVAAIQANCKKCLEAYTKHIEKQKIPKRKVKIQVYQGCASVEECPDDVEVEIKDLD